MTDVDLDLDLVGVATPSAAAAPTEGEQAQAIDCGGVRVAVPYSWARTLVEQFDLAPVPNAPAWLAGAANVDGRCVAVIDLGTWVADAPDASAARRSRLLVGGEGDESFALRFQGLPTMVRRANGDAAGAPERLRPYVLGCAGAAQLPLIDPPALARAWAADIAR